MVVPGKPTGVAQEEVMNEMFAVLLLIVGALAGLMGAYEDAQVFLLMAIYFRILSQKPGGTPCVTFTSNKLIARKCRGFGS